MNEYAVVQVSLIRGEGISEDAVEGSNELALGRSQKALDTITKQNPQEDTGSHWFTQRIGRKCSIAFFAGDGLTPVDRATRSTGPRRDQSTRRVGMIQSECSVERLMTL